MAYTKYCTNISGILSIVIVYIIVALLYWILKLRNNASMLRHLPSYQNATSNTYLNKLLNENKDNLIYYGSDESISTMFNNDIMMEKFSNHGNHSLLKRFPRCICIGTAKSGTEAILVYLSFHPQVVCYMKEGRFFVKNNSSLRQFENYLSWMPYSTKDQVTFEKSPQYVSWENKEIPRRIYKFDTGVKLLVTVRNPVDRAISYYYHFKKPDDQGFEVSVLTYFFLNAYPSYPLY